MQLFTDGVNRALSPESLAQVRGDVFPDAKVKHQLLFIHGSGSIVLYRSRKAAAKMHTRLPVGSFIPSVVRIEAGRPDDCTMADELTKDMKGGDVLLADRAYVDFLFLHNLTARGVSWALRQKADMQYEVVESRRVSGDDISDGIVRLTAANTSGKHPQAFRRVRATVEVNGERREMTFLTNNVKWAASTICELYKARWGIEVFFKELKRTLQLTDFIGTNENSVWRAFERPTPNPVG